MAKISVMSSSRVNRANQVAFWAGAAAVVVGVAAHLPDFAMAAGHDHHMSDMAWSPRRLAGMVLIIGGIVTAVLSMTLRARAAQPGRFTVRAIEHRRLTARDAGWMLIMTLALVIDGMKPISIGFVLPGMRAEYGLSALHAGLLPITALTGTAVGSVVWGLTADRIGRRSSMLLAVIMFIGTAACGAMPQFAGNLVMCFFMGASAGGLLPVAFSLLAEIMPGRHYARVATLVSGIAGAGGFLAASTVSALLEPHFGWRVMWLVGLPTGVLLLPLIRLVPESPRYLALTGRRAEAAESMRRLGVRLVEGTGLPASEAQPLSRTRPLHEPDRPRRPLVLVLCMYGFACGLVNVGVTTWLPSLLRGAALEDASASAVLTRAGLFALPVTIVLSLLYGWWRSTGSLGLIALVTACTTFGLAGWMIGRPAYGLLVVLVVLVIAGVNSAIAILGVYSAEVYPTVVRAGMSGVVAGATKLGGRIGPQIVAVLIALRAGGAVPLALLAVPLLAVSWLIVQHGVAPKAVARPAVAMSADRS